MLLTLSLTIQAYSQEAENQRIKQYLNNPNNKNLLKVDGIQLFSTEVLPRFYEKINYQPVWRDTTLVMEAGQILAQSWREGLDPQDYHLEALKELVDSQDPEKKAAFDIILTDAMLMYSSHLYYGKVNPKTLNPAWNYDKKSLSGDPVSLMEKAMESQDLKGVLKNLEPKIGQYALLKKALLKYSLMDDMGGWKSLPSSLVVKPETKGEKVKLLVERLESEGYLEMGYESDSVDDTLLNSIKYFQKDHGLDADGVVGKATVRAMNIPVSFRLDQIKANMERSRWVNTEKGFDDFLVVNIPSFSLYYLRDDTVNWTTRVVVGKKYTMTPVFQAEMKYVEFNPTWTLPRSIATKEVLPKLKRDPNYLKNRNMVLLTHSGKEVDQNSINWQDYNARNFPFIIRQEPGTHNALGRVKFIFPNPYSVYLHDTPSKTLFLRSTRAFSHGCVRVQDPIMLALLILMEDQQMTQEQINKILDTDMTKRVYLKSELPVMMMYWTVLASGNQVFFFNDIYGRDTKLVKALSASPFRK
ncbi:murein L,D-transpeptidase YcbB/YkuD [Aureibacter tunicatorum]|uniref:Murein L,D-transpeptidase YcbB/YkuD n=2 Tax=Aureibacter tunicatorum TaxID=866807 RepID=A0AAE3XM85_9BACT|nr:murein L,D-transpeptidase YcbB/YkuD [Aureibacter tunicatorum]